MHVILVMSFSWSLKKQWVIALSIAEVKYIATTSGVDKQ